jgi:hypothetical protein
VSYWALGVLEERPQLAPLSPIIREEFAHCS